jgi:hypothetical protein
MTLDFQPPPSGQVARRRTFDNLAALVFAAHAMNGVRLAIVEEFRLRVITGWKIPWGWR